jgi:hypothetical protein
MGGRDDHLIPTSDALRPLFPDGGLRRGTTVGVTGTGATSLAFALVAEASTAGAWCAVVGSHSLGLLAAEHVGVALDRFVLVADPGDDWPAVTAALLDAFEVVVLRPPSRTTTPVQRRLAARLRERDRVLLLLGDAGTGGLAADLHLTAGAEVWEGLGWGAGHLSSRQLRVRAEGRRLAGRGRQTTVWLPDPRGGVTALPRAAAPTTTPRRIAGVA